MGLSCWAPGAERLVQCGHVVVATVATVVTVVTVVTVSFTSQAFAPLQWPQ